MTSPAGDASSTQLAGARPAGPSRHADQAASQATFCDVALPIPLAATFTYRVNGALPPVGGRVLVPFRSERLAGVVTALHCNPPHVEIRNVLHVLDAGPLLDAVLMQLADWISHYYVAPIGEVFRSMLPLMAEVRRVRQYRIAPAGLAALGEAAERGSSLRSRLNPDDQAMEYAVLNRLTEGDAVREAALRSATGASRALLQGMARKKWITREDASSPADARRLVRYLQLARRPAARETNGKPAKPNLAQQRLLAALGEAPGGRLPLTEARRDFSPSSIQTLLNRGELAIVEEPAEFTLTRVASPRACSFELNPAQQRALAHIRAASEKSFSVTLLHGVTGSGKTAVYLAAMREVLDRGRSAILLVPEIGLTPAMAADVATAFGPAVAILHSALNHAERAEQWRRIHRGEARIVVGTRSAVFAPVRGLALIIVDEEHDSSYKQEESPRYHARDVAAMRGKLAGAAVVLGSATPSLESFHNAQQKKYALVELTGRVEQRPLPQVELVDMRNEFASGARDNEFLSRRLLEEVRLRLDRQEQSLILLNRRGYSPVVLCRTCGKTVECPNCAIAMTHHKRRNSLECHYCGARRGVPQVCPECSSEYVFFVGAGSEQLEERLHGLFPRARIARLDRDTVRGRYDFERVLSQLHSGDIDVLVGTQMIAKGHDVHGVTLVGIIGADVALGFPDFRAAERTFQLITQVAGRAGRGQTPGQVILQTFFQDHYAIQFAAAHDYASFAEKELRFRRWMHYPPFTALANLMVRSTSLEAALALTGKLGRWFEAHPDKAVRVLGPAAAPIARLKREFRYHFILKAESRRALNAIAQAAVAFAAAQKSQAHLIVDIDALSLL